MREVLSPSCTCKSRLPSKRSLGYLVPEGSLEVGMRGGNGACEAWDVAATVALSGSSWAPSLWVRIGLLGWESDLLPRPVHGNKRWYRSGQAVVPAALVAADRLKSECQSSTGVSCFHSARTEYGEAILDEVLASPTDTTVHYREPALVFTSKSDESSDELGSTL
ncbi:hypothetical protein ACOSQ3_028736 [Xanthoceras sorbifolium]